MLVKKAGQDITADIIIDSTVNQAGRDLIINMEAKAEIDFVITQNSQADVMPTSLFQGRDIQIKELKEHISNGKKAILVHGMGGIGKSEICRTIFQEYLNRHHSGEKIEFEHIGLLKYDKNMDETLVNAFQNYLSAKSWDEKRDQAWGYLRKISNESNTLLILDGVDNQVTQDSSLKGLRSLSCWIIMTSRNKLFEEFYPVEIRALDYFSCKILFFSIYGTIQETDEFYLKHIINELALGHTLTVKLFACLARDNSWTIIQLKIMLKKNHFNLSYLNGGQEEILIEEYKKLFQLSNLNEKEINILEAFSVLPYHMLPIEYCNTWLSKDIEMESVVLLINSINQKGWLESNNREFTMHPVISETIRSICKPSIEDHIHLVIACSSSMDIEVTEFRKQVVPVLIFAESILKYLFCDNSIVMADLLAIGGKMLYHQANYRKSIEWFMKSLQIIRNLSETDHFVMATLYNMIGAVYHAIGDYKNALEWSKKALVIREEELGSDSLATAGTYTNIAVTYQYQGEFEQALKYSKKALFARENILGINHEDTANSYINIGGVYLYQGNYKKALEYLYKALDICEKVFGRENPAEATIYQNIGTVFQNLGEYEKALKCFKKALSSFNKVYGIDHPFISSIYNNIGVVYKMKGNYEVAIRWLKKSLLVSENILGEHPDIASTYGNIGLVYQKQHDYKNAMKCYRKALFISEKLSGSEHYDMAAKFHNIAFLYQEQGDYKKAEEWYIKALIIQEKVLGSGHPDTGYTYHNLSLLYYVQEDYENALKFILKSYLVLLKIFGENYQKTLNEIEQLKKVYLLSGKNEMNFQKWLDNQSTIKLNQLSEV